MDGQQIQAALQEQAQAAQQAQAALQHLQWNQVMEWEAHKKAQKEEETRANNVSSSTPDVQPGSGSSSYGTSYSSYRASDDSFRKRCAENLNWLFQCWIITLFVRWPFLVMGLSLASLAYQPELQLLNLILRITADFRSP